MSEAGPIAKKQKMDVKVRRSVILSQRRVLIDQSITSRRLERTMALFTVMKHWQFFFCASREPIVAQVRMQEDFPLPRSQILL
jgi:hypothetical protein